MHIFTALLIGIFAMLAGTTCLAECPPELDFTKSSQTLGTLRTFGVDAGDVDLDGDNDVIVTSYHTSYFGFSKLWLNNGDRTFSLSPQVFSMADVHDAAFGDFNGDTYPDVFLVSQEQPSKVFFNTGTGMFTAGSQDIGVASDVPFEVKIGDVDRDGDLDALLSCGVGQQLWLNDGTGIFTLTTTPLPAGRAGCINLADLNGDTYLDLFISLMDLPDEVWLNDGAGSFVNSGQALGPADGYAYPASGDVDNDGDIDIVVGNSGHDVTVWLNQDNTGVLVDAGYHLDPGARRVELFDADLDGDLDLITALSSSGTKLWRNTGTVSFSLVGTIFGAAGALDIVCADLDGDLDRDVVFGYGETDGGNPVYFNETSGGCYGTVTDVDGNTYWTIRIGTQVWMTENLKVTHYRNGESIPNIPDSVLWVNQTSGASCSYANDEANTAIYGRLYNWYAAADSRNIAPAGWHVPTDAEWQTLIDYLGGASVAGWKLKETGSTLWPSPNSGTNESDFSALPGGYRGSTDGVFGDLGNYATFWSSTAVSSTHGWYRNISYDLPEVAHFDSRKFYGMSIRCVKDASCCVGTTGNINMSGIVDLGDLALLVAYLTNSPTTKPSLSCPEEANVNTSGIVDSGDLALLVAYLTNPAGEKPTLPYCSL